MAIEILDELKNNKILSKYDFSISRAYYAMFYSAEALLLTKDLRFSKHSGVNACFGREFIKEGVFSEQLYNYLIKGFRERQKGDYDVVSMPFEKMPWRWWKELRYSLLRSGII
jgi:uncharacterized protein (UPF0332 family)